MSLLKFNYHNLDMMYQDKNQGINNSYSINIILVLMGLFVFSPFSSILVIDIIGIPFSLPEVIFLPFLLILRKRYVFSSIFEIRTVFYLLLWTLLLIISLLYNQYSFSTLLSSARSYFTLIIAYLIFSKDNNVSIDDVMFISLGATIGWLVSSFWGINNYLSGEDADIARCGNMLAIPLLLGISALKKHNKIFYFSVILCIAVSLTAGMRRQILVFILSLLLTYIFIALKDVRKFMQLLLRLLIIVILFLIYLPDIKEYSKENIPNLYFRVFEKSEMFVTGQVTSETGDDVRIDNFTNLKEEFNNFFIPRGYISRRTIEDDTGHFIDFPLSELFYMLGGFFSIFLLILIGFYMFKSFGNYLSANSVEDIIIVLVTIIMFFLLFLEGTFLSSSYVAPVTGYCLGRLRYLSKSTSKQKL